MSRVFETPLARGGRRCAPGVRWLLLLLACAAWIAGCRDSGSEEAKKAEAEAPGAFCAEASREGQPCDDGDPCTYGDRCQDGACAPGPPLPCDDEDPCTEDTCDPRRVCVYTPVTCPAGEACRPDVGCVPERNTARRWTTPEHGAVTSWPEVAVLDDGGFVVVFEHHQDLQTLDDVRALRVASDRQTVLADVRVNARREGTQRGPQVASLEGGGFVVGWLDDERAKIRIYDAKGAPVGPEQAISTGKGRQSLPSLQRSAGRTFVVAWIEKHPNESAEVMFRRMTVDGEAVGEPVVVAGMDSFPDTDAKADVCPLANTDAVLTWIDQDEGSGRTRVHHAKVFEDNSVAPLGQVDDGRGGPAYPVCSAVQAVSHVVVWQSKRAGEDAWEVVGQRFDESGMPVDDAFLLSEDEERSQRDPDVAPTPSGGFVATWSSWPADSRLARAALRVFDARGRALDSLHGVEPGSLVHQERPRIDVGPKGDATVVLQGTESPPTLQVWSFAKSLRR